MPPKKDKNILLMVTNIGSTSLEQNSLDDEPFIDKAKYAIKTLIEKKIFMQPKDEIGIITMGDETDNPENLDFIKLYHEHLLVPNWEMVKYIDNISSTSHVCNWIEALHVALNFIQREVVELAARVFLVVFNNFKEDAESIDQYDSDVIASELKRLENLHLLFVGENPILDKSWQKKNVSPSEKFVLSILNEVNGQYEQINDFIETRRFYIPPPTRPVAWSFELEWAGLSMYCAEYVKVNADVKLGSWKMQAVDDDSSNVLNDIEHILGEDTTSKSRNVTNVVKENVKIDMHRNEIESDQIINGYLFGGKYIPFSDEDEAAMKYSGSQRGMMIYGFILKSEVKLEYWSGHGSRIIVPSESESATLFYSFVKAMAEKDYAAIVRKVHANNNLAKMGILFPRLVEDDIWCLVHLELPYIHDLRTIEKRPIKTLDNIVDKQKLDVLDDFIDSMTISDGEPDYLNPGMFPNVLSQYHWNAMADRALHPEGPLLPLNSYLKNYLVSPPNLSIKAKPYVEKLCKVFAGCEIKKDIDKKSKSIHNTPNAEPEEKHNINEVNNGTPHPSESDFDDKGFFTAEEVDLKMEELEDM